MLNPKATLAVIICHMLTGSASVATRYLVGTMQPLDIAFLRYLLGGLALLPLLLVARRQSLSGRLVIQILSLGILFFGLFPWIHATAFQYTTASRGAIVLATMPIWAMLLGHFLGSDPFSLRTLSGIFLAVAGVGIALYDKSLSADIGAGFQGELIMLVAAIVGAIYSVFSKPVLKHTTAYLFTPLAMLSGCLFLSPMAVQ
ncbi:MAG TPA: DMT family transporter, partial [Gammaproteobacteria bacterium]|nr:DMT family transporter [Gammaproteobacteria bacterium]